MKKYIAIISLLLVGLMAISQPNKKPGQKEKALTQKEMEDMMKEAQKMMDQMNPDDKKMMDSLGIKVPSLKEVPKVSDRELADAWEEENRVVPLKDNARIASVFKTPLGAGSLQSYLLSTHEKILTVLEKEEKVLAEKLWQYLRSKDPSATATGNAGVGCLLMGRPLLALYILGRSCKEDPTDADNLNNYSACLTMTGGEQFAIPVLNYLNAKFPKNSTILNNLSQAWFGLGDLDKAGKYSDSTILFCAWHPQANLVKAKIAESKGDKTHAIEAIKNSIALHYSSDKEDELRKLDYKLNSDDLSWNFPKKNDGLGLEAFKHPDFPKSVNESIELESQWKEFRKECDEAISALQSQMNAATEKMNKRNQQVINENMGMIQASQQAGRPLGMLNVMPFYARKATLKLKKVLEGNDGFDYKLKKYTMDMAEYAKGSEKIRTQWREEIKKWAKIEADEAGEGRPNRSYCAQKKDASDKFLNAYNPEWQALNDAYLKLLRNRINEEAYWLMYIQWPEQFEVTKIQFKIGWLNALRNLNFESITEYNCGPLSEKKPGAKLANFNDIHCDYESTLNLFLGTIKSSCDKLVSKIDLSVIKLGWEQDFGNNKRTLTEQFVKGTLEVGYKKGFSVGNGPFKMEAKVGAAVFIDFDRSGLTDGGIKAVADIKVGTNIFKPYNGTDRQEDANGDPLNFGWGPVKDPSITIVGAEAKISLNSGFSAEGRGILKLLNPTPPKNGSPKK